MKPERNKQIKLPNNYLSKVIRGSLIFIHPLQLSLFFLIWERWICFFSDLWDCWWICLCGISGSILWSENFSKNSNLLSFWNRQLATAVTTDASRNITRTDDVAGSVHPSSQSEIFHWRNVKTCKFWFRVRRRGRRSTKSVFLYYFMDWNRLSFLQIWLFSYLSCLLIYNVLFIMLYFIWCLEKSSILFVVVSCSIEWVLYWCLYVVYISMYMIL